jgi:hypothetical protein
LFHIDAALLLKLSILFAKYLKILTIIFFYFYLDYLKVV